MKPDRTGRRLHTVAHVPPDKDRPPQSDQLAAGVPLAKLIKRELVPLPELVMAADPRSFAAEKFRRLKMSLAQEGAGAPRVIAVTSTGPGEGKSVISTNLALAFADDLEGEVLLIDADLRRPTIDDWIQPAPKLGLTELLSGRTEADHTILEIKDSRLRVLPAGSSSEDPVPLLSSERARDLIKSLRSRFHHIIVDTPPVVAFTDAEAIGAFCDGVLFVARSGMTRRALFKQAVASMTATRVLGAVFNDVTYNLADRDTYGYYTQTYYKYYGKEQEK